MLGVVCGDIEKRAKGGYSTIGICESALQPVKGSQVVFTSFQTLHGQWHHVSANPRQWVRDQPRV
jgi:hypothetical protein